MKIDGKNEKEITEYKGKEMSLGGRIKKFRIEFR